MEVYHSVPLFINIDRRALLIGSGGLSHEPLVPTTVSLQVAEGLIAGRHPTVEARPARQERVIATAQQFAAVKQLGARANRDNHQFGVRLAMAPAVARTEPRYG